MTTGILLIQVGTPDAPTAPALRRYLRQFLGDPRVIDLPRWPWWLVLNLFILPFRPARSAAKYRRIWDPQTGSPLLHWTRRQAALLQEALPDVPVRFGMQVGNPSVAALVDELIRAGVERLGWPAGKWTQSFQSLFGRSEWLRPYTDETLRELAGRGARRVFVAMPGFTADCLETVDEIGFEAREVFLHAGGEVLHACRCLNDHPQWIEALRTLVLQEGQGWL